MCDMWASGVRQPGVSAETTGTASHVWAPRGKEKREGEKVTEGDGNDGNGVFTWSHSIVSEEGGGGQTAMIGTMLG